MTTRFILSHKNRYSSKALLGRLGLGALLTLAATACSGEGQQPEAGEAQESLHATIGAEGGELVGKPGTTFEGVRLSIPAGALSESTEIAITPATHLNPLPQTAVACGPQFEIQPAGLKLAQPAELELPVYERIVTDNYNFPDQVKVWAVEDGKWGQRIQTSSTEQEVTVELLELNGVGAGVNPPAEQDLVKFDFAPNPKFLNCLAKYPDDPKHPPRVSAVVVRGDLNDGLFLYGEHIKPNLKFDMFTVERSSLLASGKPDPDFKNFGMAWYQSDLEANSKGRMQGVIRTILLDQIFGFDPDGSLAPTNTFQVGFWFNDPKDAEACGFDVSKPTPFNGEHQAGPLAMISLPDAETGLGPLCTKPDTSVSPARCDP
jgi:hypothetical protein